MPGSRIGVVGADQQRRLLVGVALLDDLLVGRERARVAARAGQPVVRLEQVGDLAGDLDVRGDEHDEVVADPFEIGDEVRRQQHADAVLGDDLHQALQELTPGERIEGGDGFVEDEQFGALGDRHGERDLGALASRQRAGALARIEAESLDPLFGEGRIPRGVEPGAHPQVVGDRHPRVGRGVLGHEADPAELLPVRHQDVHRAR